MKNGTSKHPEVHPSPSDPTRRKPLPVYIELQVWRDAAAMQPLLDANI